MLATIRLDFKKKNQIETFDTLMCDFNCMTLATAKKLPQSLYIVLPQHMALFWTLKRHASKSTHFCRNQCKHLPLELSFSLHIHASLISEAALQRIPKNG